MNRGYHSWNTPAAVCIFKISLKQDTVVFVFKIEFPMSSGIGTLFTTNERSSYWQSYMGRVDDIQTALMHLQKIEVHFL